MADDTAAPQDTTSTDTPDTAATDAPATGEDALGDAGKQALDRMKAERNEAAKQLKALQKELEAVRAASMSDAEKAVAEAEKRGQQTATAAFGQRLASAEFVAVAARRNPGFDAKGVLEDLNLAKYVNDNGEPDTAGIAAAVERLVPAADRNPRPSGDADQGPRGGGRPDPGPGVNRLRAAYSAASTTP